MPLSPPCTPSSDAPLYLFSIIFPTLLTLTLFSNFQQQYYVLQCLLYVKKCLVLNFYQRLNNCFVIQSDKFSWEFLHYCLTVLIPDKWKQVESKRAPSLQKWTRDWISCQAANNWENYQKTWASLHFNFWLEWESVWLISTLPIITIFIFPD